MQIEFDGIVFMEDDTYISYCPKLDISSCGNTIGEAWENLKIAVGLFIEEAERMGTLEEILTESGYQLNEKKYWQAPRIVATESMRVAC